MCEKECVLIGDRGNNDEKGREEVTFAASVGRHVCEGVCVLLGF